MSSSEVSTTAFFSASEAIHTTPATSATPLEKPTWADQPIFVAPPQTSQEDFEDTGDRWVGEWPGETYNDAPQNPFSDSCSVLKSSWGTGPPVEIPSYHTHYTVLCSMDQRSGNTHYLLESNRGSLFHGHVSTKQWSKLLKVGGDGSEFASLLEQTYVSANLLFPPCHPSMTKFTGNNNASDIYMKAQAFLARSKYNNTHYANCTQQEIARCERISASPHPNLARYLGVETRKIGIEERVMRIAYQRYSMDLHAFALMKRLLRPHHVPFLLQGIRKGMRHLHNLGLVHCDLRPLNVFVTIDDKRDEYGDALLKEVVIGDFDASVEIGKAIFLKRASKDWWPSEMQWGVKAEPWIDEWCLEKMGRWLMEDGLGIWEFDASTGASTEALSEDSLEGFPCLHRCFI